MLSEKAQADAQLQLFALAGKLNNYLWADNLRLFLLNRDIVAIDKAL